MHATFTDGGFSMKTRFKMLAVAGAVAFATAASAQVTVYEHDGFQGRSFSADRPVGNFERSGFNDRASSVIVRGGLWEACEDRRFGGQCVTLRPGNYPNLGSMGLNDRISSVRPVEGGHYGYNEPGYNAPPPARYAYDGRDGRDYHRRGGERLYEAQVTSVRAVVGTPEQRCWVEQQPAASNNAIPGAIAGAVIGGILGHQVGSGRGRDVATGVGALAGGAVGANVGSQYGGGYTQDVQRCAYTQNTGRPDYYDVTYNFRGYEHRVQTTTPPGPTILVNGEGEPRV
jgi:uncharacterized protein YcfJ